MANVTKWLSEQEALREFATSAAKTQSAAHIKPLHHYIACRLVVEGGFRPEDITPRPPFEIVVKKKAEHLIYRPELAKGGEASILGGLKTKKVDVVVNQAQIGPVLGISVKGMTKSLRNLTNRIEETVGETTNLHMTYPALVFGYAFVLRGTRGDESAATAAAEVDEDIAGIAEAAAPFDSEVASEDDDDTDSTQANDIVLDREGNPVRALVRLNYALSRMSGRKSIREEHSLYEQVALAIVNVDTNPGEIYERFPEPGSSTRFEGFFEPLYRQYDERFVFSAPDLAKRTQRREWSQASPAFADADFMAGLGYSPQLA